MLAMLLKDLLIKYFLAVLDREGTVLVSQKSSAAEEGFAYVSFSSSLSCLTSLEGEKGIFLWVSIQVGNVI